MTQLMIVESPAKAKKIGGFLGEGWRVEACTGHVRDLPTAELGIEVERDFQPRYEVLNGKGNLVRRLVKAMRECEAVYLATDPDREGEAIAWHLVELAKLPDEKPIYRITFNAITAEAVRKAVDHPRNLDLHLIEAQQARRIVDRLVGYLASPVAIKALDNKVSAGRVQSVCLRLIVEREREIAAFTPQSFWTLALKLEANGSPFTAELTQLRGAELPFAQRTMPERVAALLAGAHVWVSKSAETEKMRYPHPPFTTSTLQQVAAQALGLSPDRTMALAQILYEAGKITYMRTDGVAVAPEAQAAARALIERECGVSYLPDAPPIYVAKAVNAQEAHEAIRPTDVNALPELVEGDGAALYALIWRRFIASQMVAARYRLTGAEIQAGKAVEQSFPLTFRAMGRMLVFDGFLRMYGNSSYEESDERDQKVLPTLREGQSLTLIASEIVEGQTRPPAQFTEASLIAALEAHGVGRPSTYAVMVKTVKDKGYVRREGKHLVSTQRGAALCDFLTTHFDDVLAVDYTARLESELDRIAAGDATQFDLLSMFWTAFQPQLKGASEAALSAWRGRHAPKPLLLRPKGAEGE